MINRKDYIDKLITFKDKQIIKVITGVRRAGKSVLMELFQEYLLNVSKISKDQIIAINLEDYDYKELLNPDNLHKYVKEKLQNNKMNYVFIDEVQNCKDFPRVINSLQLKSNVDLYVTGSNAFILSNELTTFLSGRYVEIKILPFSFKEFVSANSSNKSLQELYKDYLQRSSFPYVINFKDNLEAIKVYLEGIYNTIILKDVSMRMGITDTMLLESIVKFLFDNIGKPLSTKKISDTMTSFGRKVDVKTLERYIFALLDSFILYRGQRYDIKGKQFLKTLDKYYIVDIGLRYYLLGGKNIDFGHILENVIYLELLRRGYNVYVGKIDNLEVDFVCMRGNVTLYVQVSATVRDNETLKRELTSLKKINDHYPKILLTLDEEPEAVYDGIRKINALNWLVSDNAS